jgi:hypothetical protein
VRWSRAILPLLVCTPIWIGAIAVAIPYESEQQLPEDRVGHDLHTLRTLIDEALESWNRIDIADRLRYSKAVQMHIAQLSRLIKSALENGQ